MQRSFFATFTFLAAYTLVPSTAIDLSEAEEPMENLLTQLELEASANSDFTGGQKARCWASAPETERDPRRWRQDVVGNPVLKGQDGDHWNYSPYAFKYDKNSAGQCQIL